jgi:hypothetical protein
MNQELELRRKWTFRAHGKQTIFVKKVFDKILKKATKSIHRTAPIDLISFPADSEERFIHRDGAIHVDLQDVALLRC